MPVGWAAAIGAVATIGSAVVSSDASRRAANTQADAASAANALQSSEFDRTQANLQPYMRSGGNALTALMGQLGIGPNGSFDPNAPLNAPFTADKFHSSPGYEFQLKQGQDAINNSASAHGGRFSGNTLKALTRFSEGVANQDYWSAYNAYQNEQAQQFSRLFNLAGSGQNAAASLGGFGADNARIQGSNIIGAGNANAAGQVGQANSIIGGVNNLSQLAYQWGQNQQPPPSGSPGAMPASPQPNYSLTDPNASYFPSDRRLKSNIVRIGTHPLGIGIYEYDIFGERDQGVMADEVEAVAPHAIAVHKSGFKLVNYGAL